MAVKDITKETIDKAINDYKKASTLNDFNQAVLLAFSISLLELSTLSPEGFEKYYQDAAGKFDHSQKEYLIPFKISLEDIRTKALNEKANQGIELFLAARAQAPAAASLNVQQEAEKQEEKVEEVKAENDFRLSYKEAEQIEKSISKLQSYGNSLRKANDYYKPFLLLSVDSLSPDKIKAAMDNAKAKAEQDGIPLVIKNGEYFNIYTYDAQKNWSFSQEFPGNADLLFLKDAKDAKDAEDAKDGTLITLKGSAISKEIESELGEAKILLKSDSYRRGQEAINVAMELRGSLGQYKNLDNPTKQNLEDFKKTFQSSPALKEFRRGSASHIVANILFSLTLVGLGVQAAKWYKTGQADIQFSKFKLFSKKTTREKYGDKIEETVERIADRKMRGS